MRLTLALTTLCENPSRRTGLSTLYPAFVAKAVRLYPDVSWLVFAGAGQEGQDPWGDGDAAVTVCRRFPANDRPLARLWADHGRLAAEARRRGAAALVTTGFGPWRDAGLPLVLQLFSLHHQSERGLRARYRDWAVRRGLQRARLTIVNSQWLAQRLPQSPRRLLVSPEGLDTERFHPAGARGYGTLAPGYVLWAANFYPYKRVELALAAYATLPPEVRRRHPFVLAGGDWAGGRGRAEAAARELGVGADTHFLGWVPDDVLPALYRGAAVLVLSTSEESFGRSVLEAMACGLPVLVQALPVLREVAGEAAVYADFTAPREAGGALARLLADEDVRRECVARGLAQAARFSFERLARERMEAILAAIT